MTVSNLSSLSQLRVYSEPIILPFDIDGRIYVLEDENGAIMCTGRREVCVALIQIMNRAKAAARLQLMQPPSLPNVRSAITP
jgi:hypothetical protein